MLTEQHREKIHYLNQYRYADKEIDRKIRELENWKSKIFNVTSTISDMPKGSSGRADTIATGIANINEIESQINADIDDLYSLRKTIENKIDCISNLGLREILKDRYLESKTWEEIAYRSNYSWRQVYNLHEKALDLINIA